jgi:hypothetical protein
MLSEDSDIFVAGSEENWMLLQGVSYDFLY